jgi:hypothetical protein
VFPIEVANHFLDCLSGDNCDSRLAGWPVYNRAVHVVGLCILVAMFWHFIDYQYLLRQQEMHRL